MDLTKKQKELLEYILEHKEEITSHFNEQMKLEDLFKLFDLKYGRTDKKGNDTKLQRIKTFVNITEDGTKKDRTYTLTDFNYVFFDEKVPINNNSNIYLQEDFNEKTHNKMSFVEAMKYEREMQRQAMEQLNDETGATTTKLRKAIAKSIVQNLLIEKKSVIEGEFREKWYVTERELLLATGLININFNPILHDVNRFICTLDLNDLRKGKVNVIGLPKELQDMEQKVQEEKITELTYNRRLTQYIKENDITDIAEVLAEEIKLQLNWTRDRLKSSLNYLWSDLKLIETYDNGHRMKMIKTRIVNGVSYPYEEDYYPTMEEMDWLNSQYKIVMSKMTYVTKSGMTRKYKSWWKLCQDGRISEFYKLFVEHINAYSPSKFRWGTVKKIYKCKVLSFVRHQVEYDSKHDLQFTYEEIRALKQIRVIQKEKIKSLVIEQQLKLIDDRHKNAIEGKVINATNKDTNRKYRLLKQRSNKLYPKLAKSVVKVIHSDFKYKYYKSTTDLDEYKYAVARIMTD